MQMISGKADDRPISHEEEVKRAADLREWLESKISEMESEITRLRDMLLVVDSVLRKSSFVPATELRNLQEKVESPKADSSKMEERRSSGTVKGSAVIPENVEKSIPRANPSSVESPDQQPRQLRRSKDGMLIANVFVSPEKIVMVPVEDVKLSQTTPPFQSFFVNRILKGFESKDQELVQAGSLDSEINLRYEIEESDGHISKLTVINYREKNRLNEILNTASWAFSRMLEKQ